MTTASRRYTVVLATEPTSNVVVTLASSKPNVADINTGTTPDVQDRTLTFEPNNDSGKIWSVLPNRYCCPC